MSHDGIDYQQLMQAALRDVVRRTLSLVAEEGLPPGHFFYITFVTQAPGVEISSTLVDRYPDEMTIILQHQFWDLVAGPDTFSVGLSFSSQSHTLTVPYSAVVSFVDPPAEFGLRFSPPPGFETEESPVESEPGDEEQAVVPMPAAEPLPEEHAETEEATAKVVSLEDFRKK